MLYLIRHGEALGNARGVVMGQMDLPLTDRGRAQADALGRWLRARGVRLHAVYASDLRRAAETAAIVAAHCAADGALRLRAELREVARGAIEGRTFAEAETMRAQPAVLATFEPETAASERLARVGAELRAAATDDDVAAVAHGGSLSRLVRWYLGLPAARTAGGVRLEFDNTGVTVLRFDPDGAVVLRRFNAVCHLEDEG